MNQDKEVVGQENAEAAESVSRITMLVNFITNLYRLVFSHSREGLAISKDGQMFNLAGREFKNHCEGHWFKEHKALLQNQEFAQARLTVEQQTLEGDNEVKLVDDNYHFDGKAAYFRTVDGKQIQITEQHVAEINTIESPIIFTGNRQDAFAKIADPVTTLFDILRATVRLADEELMLFIGCMIKAFMPGPNPVMIFVGEQGSGKSFMAKIFQMIVDPADTGKRVKVIDNISGIGGKLSDDLCRESHDRTAIITTINPVMPNQDLVDRTILFNPRPIPNAERKTESQLLKEINDNRGGIMLIIAFAIREALRNGNTVQPGYPRLADYYHTCMSASASCPQLGFNTAQFMMALNCNRFYAVERSLNDNPVSAAILYLAENTLGKEWTGTATALHNKIKEIGPAEIKKHSNWPSQPNKLSGLIRRAAPFLRTKGLEIEWGKSGARAITIKKIAAEVERLPQEGKTESTVTGQDSPQYTDAAPVCAPSTSASQFANNPSTPAIGSNNIWA